MVRDPQNVRTARLVRAVLSGPAAGRAQFTDVSGRRVDLEATDAALLPMLGAVHVKPALAAFRTGALRLERCARNGAMATSCIR